MISCTINCFFFFKFTYSSFPDCKGDEKSLENLLIALSSIINVHIPFALQVFHCTEDFGGMPKGEYH